MHRSYQKPITLYAVAMTLAITATVAGTAFAQTIDRASFNTDGSVDIPKNWRQWVFVGAPLTPNALNGGEAPFPEFHNVYVEPTAFAHWVETGAWADGAQIAKELVHLRTGDDCEEETGACFESSGLGFFQGEFKGLELKVKDSVRFADEPGDWAYFSFGHTAPPYAATAEAFPTESCNACHEVNAVSDWVFTQYYPVLTAAKPN